MSSAIAPLIPRLGATIWRSSRRASRSATLPIVYAVGRGHCGGSGRPVFRFFGEKGHFKGYRGSATDVTAEMDSIRRAQAAHQLFAEVVESVPASLMVHDVDDRLVICNSVTRGYFPRTGHLLVPGSTFEEFTRALAETGEVPEATGREEEWFRERMRRHRLPENHITRQYADGRWVQISERRMSDAATIGIRLDITELKKAEAQRLALTVQLQHSQKLEALGTLAGGIAHELNNALVPVVALTKLTIKRLPQGSREHRNLNTIRDAAERARDLVKNILAFSRKETPTRSSVDLVALVQRPLQLLRPVIPATIRIEERIDSVPALLADPDQLHQLLINLVTNAAQAIDDQHGTIFIEVAAAHDAQSPQDSLAPSGSSVRLSVSDTGCGMDEATLKHIFDPFFTTKAVGQGTGLGLSVAHGIVTQHSGRERIRARDVLPGVLASFHKRGGPPGNGAKPARSRLRATLSPGSSGSPARPVLAPTRPSGPTVSQRRISGRAPRP
jgi:signal transduction histidine kinase